MTKLIKLALNLAVLCLVSFAYDQRYIICSSTVRVTKNDYLVSPFTWSSISNCTTRLERGIFPGPHGEILSRIITINLPFHGDTGCQDYLRFTYPNREFVTQNLCQRGQISSTYLLSANHIDVQLITKTKSGAFEIVSSVEYIRDICLDSSIYLADQPSGYLRTQWYPETRGIERCLSQVTVDPGQRLFIDVLDQQRLGCNLAEQCRPDSFLKMNGDCSCDSNLHISDLHMLDIDYYNNGVRPGRLVYFEVYGCRLSNLTLTRAHASMVPRTFEASMECDTGYALHPDRETETILENHCDISSSMWLQPGMTCFAVDCKSPPDVTHATVTYTNTQYPATAIYACNGDYNIIGSPIVTCQSNRQWSPRPFCSLTTTSSTTTTPTTTTTTTTVATSVTQAPKTPPRIESIFETIMVTETTESPENATLPSADPNNKEDALPTAEDKSNTDLAIILASVFAATVSISIIISIISVIAYKKKKTDRHIQQKRNDSSASESSGLTPTTYDAWEKTVPAQYDIASYGIEMNHALHGVTLRPHTEHCFKDKLAAEIARRSSSLVYTKVWKSATSGALQLNQAPSGGQDFLTSDSKVDLLDNDLYDRINGPTESTTDSLPVGIHVPAPPSNDNEDYYDDPNDVCYDLVDDEVDDSDFTETIPSDDEAEPIDEPLYDTVFC